MGLPITSAMPFRILNKGPDYFRRQVGTSVRKPSAVERLEADKAKYVKSKQVATTRQEPVKPLLLKQPLFSPGVRRVLLTPNRKNSPGFGARRRDAYGPKSSLNLDILSSLISLCDSPLPSPRADPTSPIAPERKGWQEHHGWTTRQASVPADGPSKLTGNATMFSCVSEPSLNSSKISELISTSTKPVSSSAKPSKPVSSSTSPPKPVSTSPKLSEPVCMPTKQSGTVSTLAKLFEPASPSTKLPVPASTSTKLFGSSLPSTKLSRPVANPTRLFAPCSPSPKLSGPTPTPTKLPDHTPTKLPDHTPSPTKLSESAQSSKNSSTVAVRRVDVIPSAAQRPRIGPALLVTPVPESPTRSLFSSTSSLTSPQDGNSDLGKRATMLHRSKSDLSDRYSRASADLERFFNYCGLDPQEVEHMGAEHFARASSDIVSIKFHSISAASSEGAPSQRSGATATEQQDERMPYGISIIERNARVIKWLYGLRQAREPQKVSKV
ncbi:hypothetical protein NDU88_001379 [Pleurodeles waltl]|uniref:Protein FAM110A n=1 Tax=Pleurodeles waltl TaxID=8319 RepID=A0AAV7P5M3_PLEWA|nr:hypothetical protein NDU88_001379 [Pleurodeles waltl]